METRRVADPQPRRRSAVTALAARWPGARWQTNLGWLLLWAVVAWLLFLALRAVPLVEIVKVLSRLGVGQVAALVFANLAILALLSLRWALLLRSLGHPLGLRALTAVRLAGFGVSYFTPGPQFGGEPVQVDLLRRRGVPLPAAISSVFLDRLVDLLANFTFLAVGVVTVLASGLFAGHSGAWTWTLAPAMLIFPLAHLGALWAGRQPLTWLTGMVAKRLPRQGIDRAAHLVNQSEAQISALCRSRPGTLVMVIALSGFVWLIMVLEFALTLQFLGVRGSPVEIVTALTAARLAFLLPFPGGIGAFEASQVFISQALGWGAPAGVALSLIIRARDLLLAVAGMWYGGSVYRQVMFDSAISDERS